ncbi:MAG: GIY-YIG nuclease family protein [Flavobacteriales bacterium]|nr:GIY-YIG nuclease family protein [Flavobacteriales bacterium]
MLFAITDIETTGSYASGNSITEICVCLFDGKEVVDTWHSLIRPEGSIPPYIVQLTGITNEMVAEAPRFEEIATELETFIDDAIFVAHNVNFDYSFIKKHFEDCGMVWNRNKLCSVRLAKKAFPGLRSYGLGNLCSHFNIENAARHRATGDTLATVELMKLIVNEVGLEELHELARKGSGEAFLPNSVDTRTYLGLPESAGVYYFHDAKGKIIYIGKARNIKKRVRSHFSRMQSERRQSFFKEIHDITFQLTGTELIALILEDHEIKRYWPRHNRAQKQAIGRFGIYTYEDQTGATRLVVKKVTNSAPPIKYFTSGHRARQWLFEFAEENHIHYKYCGLPFTEEPTEGVAEHNTKVDQALADQQSTLGSFLIKGRGRSYEEQSFVWVAEGLVKGIGFVPQDAQVTDTAQLEEYLTPIAHSGAIEAILRSFIERTPPREIVFLEQFQH